MTLFNLGRLRPRNTLHMGHPHSEREKPKENWSISTRLKHSSTEKVREMDSIGVSQFDYFPGRQIYLINNIIGSQSEN
ncbi:UNVERIFIED_CONTAM: hypothetical protein PYX00_010758 [Menopon gallinae]|uniref:Uncharacterized protein n=1 Tax=Menopon gallinae TaxID=328185 RepID=A0AAW2HGT0_9NEOP